MLTCVRLPPGCTCPRCRSLFPAGSRSFRTSTASWRARSTTAPEGETRPDPCEASTASRSSRWSSRWPAVRCVSGVCISRACRAQGRRPRCTRWCAVCSTPLKWTRSLRSTSSRSMGWRWQILIRPTSRSCRWGLHGKVGWTFSWMCTEDIQFYVLETRPGLLVLIVSVKLIPQYGHWPTLVSRNWRVRRRRPTTLPPCWRRDSVTQRPGRRRLCCWWTRSQPLNEVKQVLW